MLALYFIAVTLNVIKIYLKRLETYNSMFVFILLFLRKRFILLISRAYLCQVKQNQACFFLFDYIIFRCSDVDNGYHQRYIPGNNFGRVGIGIGRLVLFLLHQRIRPAVFHARFSANAEKSKGQGRAGDRRCWRCRSRAGHQIGSIEGESCNLGC